MIGKFIKRTKKEICRRGWKISNIFYFYIDDDNKKKCYHIKAEYNLKSEYGLPISESVEDTDLLRAYKKILFQINALQKYNLLPIQITSTEFKTSTSCQICYVKN